MYDVERDPDLHLEEVVVGSSAGFALVFLVVLEAAFAVERDPDLHLEEVVVGSSAGFALVFLVVLEAAFARNIIWGDYMSSHETYVNDRMG